MKNKLTLVFGGLLLCGQAFKAQNIGGIINNYAKVSNITGSSIGVSTATAFGAGDRVLLIQMKGASVIQSNTSNFGDITSMGGAGTFEFLNVLSVTGNVINSSAALTNTYNFATGFVQVVRVPKYCAPVVVSSITCNPWNFTTGTGGIIAFEAGTLTLNADIDANSKGFRGGNFSIGGFGCDNGGYAASAGALGGQKGESVSAFIGGLNGQKGKQANAGGGSNPGNSGGGGGGNGGAGGLGGNQYSGCGTFDDRGIGGLFLAQTTSAMFMGGGGGGGFEDNAQIASPGGNGGGIIYIKANVITSNSRTISANGENVVIIAADEASGGGGGGGTIFIESPSVNGNLSVQARGGSGGSNNNTLFPSDCHGTGGGGGGGVIAFNQAVLPAGTTANVSGGAAGTVNNSMSSCFGTTNGAGPGLSGMIISGLALTPGLNVPTLNVNPSNTSICSGQIATITVSGASNYSWSPGNSTSSVVVVSPSITTSYTVTGGDINSCNAQAINTLTVSACTGINQAEPAERIINIYPNPTTGKMSIVASSSVKVFVCDNTGRIIREDSFEKGITELDMNGLANGIYFMKTVGGEGIQVTKFVKTAN